MNNMNNITVVSLFTDIANAIREKTGSSDNIVADDFPFVLASIPDNDIFISILNKTITDIPESYLDGITTIGRSAFYRCSNLASISLPESLTTIGDQAFNYCSNLALTSLPESLTTIGDQAFANCSNLALTSLPESLTTIGDQAFYRCSNLASISLPESLTTIGFQAFAMCSNLKSLSFKGTPTTINPETFYYCRNLTTINVPWSEGEVANAPWGAPNATINYNYAVA